VMLACARASQLDLALDLFRGSIGGDDAVRFGGGGRATAADLAVPLHEAEQLGLASQQAAVLRHLALLHAELCPEVAIAIALVALVAGEALPIGELREASHTPSAIRCLKDEGC